MKNKNKINFKKILVLSIIFIVLVIAGIFFYRMKSNNDANGVFSVLEKRWIEKNKSTVIDVSIANDIPIFGYQGNGVFFDFLDSFNKDTGLQFNKIPYNTDKNSKQTGYIFEINQKKELADNEKLIYKDNYVMISKDSNKIKNFDDLDNSIVGVLESDLSIIKEYLGNNEDVIYNNYNSVDSIVTALNNNDIKYAIIPKNTNIDKIFSNNFSVVYNITDICTNYVLRIDGEENVLNSIFKKYYTRWMKDDFYKAYNDRLTSLYFDKKEYDEIVKANFKSKDYVYGYVRNVPYESKINDEFIGYNSEILDDFANISGVTFKVKEYNSIKDLTKALNDGKVDVAFNYYKFDNLTNNFDYSFSAYNEKIVILTSYQNVTTTVSSLTSLKNKNVVMLDNKLANYMSNKLSMNVKTYKKTSSLFNSIGKDDIVILDYNTYNYYKNSKLDDYKVIYEQKLDTDFNFILLNSNKNKAFVSFFKYYISTINTDLYKSRALLKFNNDSKKIDLSYIYFFIGLIIVIVFSVIYFKNKNVSNKIKKEDKMKYVDHLTSLKNRHYLNENYVKWQANKIYPQAIIVININKVGHINDVYGHEEGDMVIRKAANILINNQLEQSDIVRTNGDEFLIYMVGYEETKVITYMRRLYKEFKNLPYKFGASLGYSMILDDVKTIDDAINEAVLEIKTNKESSEDK